MWGPGGDAGGAPLGDTMLSRQLLSLDDAFRPLKPQFSGEGFDIRLKHQLAGLDECMDRLRRHGLSDGDAAPSRSQGRHFEMDAFALRPRHDELDDDPPFGIRTEPERRARLVTIGAVKGEGGYEESEPRTARRARLASEAITAATARGSFVSDTTTERSSDAGTPCRPPYESARLEARPSVARSERSVDEVGELIQAVRQSLQESRRVCAEREMMIRDRAHALSVKRAHQRRVQEEEFQQRVFDAQARFQLGESGVAPQGDLLTWPAPQYPARR